MNTTVTSRTSMSPTSASPYSIGRTIGHKASTLLSKASTFLSASRKSSQLAIRRIVPKFAANILFFGGLGSMSYGAWMIYHPLGLITAGLFSVWIASLLSAEIESGKK